MCGPFVLRAASSPPTPPRCAPGSALLPPRAEVGLGQRVSVSVLVRNTLDPALGRSLGAGPSGVSRRRRRPRKVDPRPSPPRRPRRDNPRVWRPFGLCACCFNRALVQVSESAVPRAPGRREIQSSLCCLLRKGGMGGCVCELKGSPTLPPQSWSGLYSDRNFCCFCPFRLAPRLSAGSVARPEVDRSSPHPHPPVFLNQGTAVLRNLDF